MITRSYADADALLGPLSGRNVANNTCLCRNGGDTIAVVFYDTPIVTYHPNGDIVLTSQDHHGKPHRTSTTLQRINQYLPYDLRVRMLDGVWYVHQNGAPPIPFMDGMKLRVREGE